MSFKTWADGQDKQGDKTGADKKPIGVPVAPIPLQAPAQTAPSEDQRNDERRAG